MCWGNGKKFNLWIVRLFLRARKTRRKVFPSDSDVVALFSCLGLCSRMAIDETSARVWHVQLKPQLWHCFIALSLLQKCAGTLSIIAERIFKICKECLKYNLRGFSTFIFQQKGVTQYTRHELAPRMYELICFYIIIFSIFLYSCHI